MTEAIKNIIYKEKDMWRLPLPEISDTKTYWEFVIAIMVAAFGLLNALITVFLTPIFTDRREKLKFEREKLYERSVALVNYASKITFEDSYDVLKLREQCMKIHMLFDNGRAPGPLDAYMEDIFELFYLRKERIIPIWGDYEREITRKIIRKMRRELSHYIKKGLKHSVLDWVIIRIKTKKLKQEINWIQETNALIAELDSRTYIHYIEVDRLSSAKSTSITIHYYRSCNDSLSRIIEDINKLKTKYGCE